MNESLISTLQHIGLIVGKIERLESARDDACEAFCAAVGRQYKAGDLDIEDLAKIYGQYRQACGHRSGFSSAWTVNTGVSVSQIAYMQRSISKRKPNDRDASGNPRWLGVWPIGIDDSYPMNNKPVVYILFGDNGEPCYVGSTQKFYDRLAQHDKSGKVFKQWIAYPCRTRDEAYNKEADYLDAFMPDYNRRREGRR